MRISVGSRFFCLMSVRPTFTFCRVAVAPFCASYIKYSACVPKYNVSNVLVHIWGDTQVISAYIPRCKMAPSTGSVRAFRSGKYRPLQKDTGTWYLVLVLVLAVFLCWRIVAIYLLQNDTRTSTGYQLPRRFVCMYAYCVYACMRTCVQAYKHASMDELFLQTPYSRASLLAEFVQWSPVPQCCYLVPRIVQGCQPNPCSPGRNRQLTSTPTDTAPEPIRIVSPLKATSCKKRKLACSPLEPPPSTLNTAPP